jgi:hypothetical protein
MAHVADVQRSVDFYKLLGLKMHGKLRNPSGQLQWVQLHCEQADIMFTRASEPVISSQQSVLFYLHSPHLAELTRQAGGRLLGRSGF